MWVLEGCSPANGEDFCVLMGDAQETWGQFPGEIRNLNPRDNVNVRFLGTTDGRGTFFRAAERMGRSCLLEGLSSRRSEFRRSLSGCGTPSQSGFPLIGRTGPQGGCHYLHHIGRLGDLEGMSCSRPAGGLVATGPQTLGLVRQPFLPNAWDAIVTFPVFSP